MHIKRLLAAIAGLMLPLAATAEDNPVVVELFTSQGCSSCPPADRMLGELTGRADVLPLSLHVDYWDYIGWADTFASPDHTARQKGYAAAAGSTVIYTPQTIIGGRDHVVGYRPMSVADLIAAHAAKPDPIAVTVRAGAAGGFVVRAVPVERLPAARIDVHLVAYSPHEVVEIARGENAGRRSSHHNVVRGWAVVAEWNGQGVFEREIAPESGLPHAVLFQTRGHGPILAAARLD